MADGVTKLGGGWDQVPAGTAEAALRDLIAAGTLTGDAIAQQLVADGFGARGPAYYPKDNGKGPFYALGNPHDYAAIDVVDGAPQWDLIGYTPSGGTLEGDLAVLFHQVADKLRHNQAVDGLIDAVADRLTQG